MKKSRGAWNAIEVMMNRENARVIRKAFLEKSQGPETLDRNCIVRHTIRYRSAYAPLEGAYSTDVCHPVQRKVATRSTGSLDHGHFM
jgi:hypothetical protein